MSHLARVRGAVAGLAASDGVRAARLVAETDRGAALALAALVVAGATLPNVLFVAIGAVVARLPGLVSATPSQARADVLVPVVVASVVLWLNLLLAPAQDAVGTAVRSRLGHRLQQRLIVAVGAPTGIEHLEDPTVLRDLALASGSLSGSDPAAAPELLARVLAARLAGAVSCAIVAGFRWWLGVGLAALWLLLRRPVKAAITANVAAFGGEAGVMRRADYFRRLAVSRTAAGEIRVFGLADWLVGQFRAHWLAGMTTVWRLRRDLHRTMALVGLAAAAAWTVAYLLLGAAAVDGDVGVGALAVLLPAIAATARVGSVTLDDIWLEWRLSALPHIDQLEQRLAGPPTTGGPRQPPAAGDIHFEDLSFGYTSTPTPVLSHVDLRIPAGRATAIVGPNGAGKTTAAKLLAGLLTPDAGTITVGGVAIHDGRTLQAMTAAVFQEPLRLPLSVAECIGYGAIKEHTDQPGIQEAATAAGAAAMIAGLPHGSATVLSRDVEGGVDLSTGQWQAVALARALFALRHGRSFLLLDEPTASLDSEAEAAVLDRLFGLTGEATIVVISHRFSTVRHADHIVVMEGGHVVEQGTHEQLLMDDGLYARMFHAQANRVVGTP
jgi:ABC-type multidrug transport system fused ATPase/permease subunit